MDENERDDLCSAVDLRWNYLPPARMAALLREVDNSLVHATDVHVSRRGFNVPHHSNINTRWPIYGYIPCAHSGEQKHPLVGID